MALIGTLACPSPSVPLVGLLSKEPNVVRVLWALTQVAPTVTKSPTWARARPPIILVALVRVSALETDDLTGLLILERRSVPAYLSAAKSSWIPLNAGLEKVMGVSVVRI